MLEMTMTDGEKYKVDVSICSHPDVDKEKWKVSRGG